MYFTKGAPADIQIPWPMTIKSSNATVSARLIWWWVDVGVALRIAAVVSLSYMYVIHTITHHQQHLV